MLCLRHQVCGNKFRICGFIRHDQNLAGACNHIDIHYAIQQLLCGSYKDVSRADNLVHLRNLFGTICQRCNGLCAAGEEYTVYAAQSGCHQNIRIRCAILAGRCYHDDLLHAGNLCRNSIHNNTGRISCRATRYIQAHTLQAADTLSQNHTVRQSMNEALLHLALVEIANVFNGIQHSIHKRRICIGQGVIDYLSGHLIIFRQAAVKFQGVILDCLIAAFLDGANNFADSFCNALVCLAGALVQTSEKCVTLCQITGVNGFHSNHDKASSIF